MEFSLLARLKAWTGCGGASLQRGQTEHRAAPSVAEAAPREQGLTLTAVPGILVGHVTDKVNRTGCTAIVCPSGCTPGVAVPGFAPGSRETELMRSEALVEEVHGLLLGGGSAFGLAAATGVVHWLTEQQAGFVTPHARIPLVPAAVIYDLDMNRQPGTLPDEAMGYAAASVASAAAVEQGAVGAGTGARCGRLAGFEGSAKSGLGSAGVRVGEVLVTALVVVNALGNVHDPVSGDWLAGGRDAQGSPLVGEALYRALGGGDKPFNNTVLTVVATNVPLSKVQTNRLAHMAGAGLARTIRPAHLLYDGDMVFALSSKQGPTADECLLGAMGADAVAQAAAAAVRCVEAE